ncbi:hypothetical protein [Flavobacterium sp. LC2016-01]|uniref:hypothetical protein n=1 Tax=Flavobacterium sp. LC2016-01 TaxID=2675876 RepID=UPI0012BAD038|nr:hypothetical protein [Flavobacterium sp. LC2016-01]MTH15025.1 hypothetical protein [Flavobacterium sp. LC2016-01]
MKRNIFIFLLLIISVHLSAQINMVSKKIFLDSLNHECTPENYFYTRIITNYSQKSVRYVITDFYKNGRKKMTGATLDKDVLKKDGEFICYYKNGAKESVVNYLQDHKEGKEINWYENQSKKFEKQHIWNPKTKSVQILILNFWNTDKEQTVIDGNGEYESTDNFVTEKGVVKNGLKQGAWKGKDLIRKITFTENYDKGILISGVAVNEYNYSYSYSSLNERIAPKKTPTNH